MGNFPYYVNRCNVAKFHPKTGLKIACFMPIIFDIKSLIKNNMLCCMTDFFVIKKIRNRPFD